MTAFAQLAAVGRGSNTCIYVIAIFTMCESTEQGICIKFVLKLEKPQRKRINYCSKHTVKMQCVVHKCLTGSVDLKKGRTSVESDPRSGRPSTSRNEEMIAKVRTIVRNNRRLTVREIADDCATFA